MTEPAKPRDLWLLPSIAGVVALLSLFVPMSCNASANGTAYATADGGPLVLGALAIVLAAVALMRVRRGAPAVVALIVAVAGGVQVARGVGLMKRVPSAAEKIDLDRPVREVLAAVGAGHAGDLTPLLPADATPEQLRTFDGLARGWSAGLGHWLDLSGLTQTVDDHGLAVATGDARFERKHARFTMSFAVVSGLPRLVNIDLTLPASERPPLADAEALARAVTTAIANDDVDAIHAAMDPRVGDMASLDTAFRKIHDAGATPTLELVSHNTCGNGECYELRFPLSTGSQRVRLTLTWTFGVWMVDTLTLGDG